MQGLQSSVLKHVEFFFPLEKSPSRACSSFSDCNFKISWSRSLHVFKSHYCFSLSLLKKPTDVGWADDSKWHCAFCEYFKPSDNKRDDSGFERKKGEDFTWLWRRWLREVVLWRGKAPQSRYIPLASISWKDKILGLSSGNPCWLWEMPLLGWLSWFSAFCGSVWGLWQSGEDLWDSCSGTMTLNTCPGRRQPHPTPGMAWADSLLKGTL